MDTPSGTAEVGPITASSVNQTRPAFTRIRAENRPPAGEPSPPKSADSVSPGAAPGLPRGPLGPRVRLPYPHGNSRRRRAAAVNYPEWVLINPWGFSGPPPIRSPNGYGWTSSSRRGGRGHSASEHSCTKVNARRYCPAQRSAAFRAAARVRNARPMNAARPVDAILQTCQCCGVVTIWLRIGRHVQVRQTVTKW